MNPSISMWSLDRAVASGSITQVEFIDWAASLDLRYVELLSYYMNREDNLNEVRANLSRCEVAVSAYTIMTDFTDPQDFKLGDYINDLDIASELGAPFVRVLGGEADESSNGYANMIEGLKRGSELAGERNLILILENIGHHTGSSEALKRVITEIDSPQLKINFDTANPLLYGEDPRTALNSLLDSVAYIHFKDFLSERSDRFESIAARDPSRIQTGQNGIRVTGVAGGTGEVPMKEILQDLAGANYKGIISVEYEGTGNSVEDTKMSLEFLRSAI